jgi:general secretion pathway protein A
MYQAHWGLNDTPFKTRLDRRFFYQSPTHEEALARLHFLVEQERRLGLLMGGDGEGKSFVLEIFAEEMRKAGHAVANFNLLGVLPAEFLWLLASALLLNPERELPIPLLWRMVTDRLAEYRYQQQKVVVLLDDADRATPEVLTQVARLAQVDLSPDSQLTIVLAGRPRHIGRLSESLLERAELRIDLEPWQPGDTEDFLNHSLAQAGRNEPVFASPAVARLHELAQGIPRRISQLADLALLAGAGRNLDQIDVDTVDSVYHELGVVQA